MPPNAGGAWSSAAGPVPSLGTASASAPERSAAGCPATSFAGSGTTSTTMSLDCRASAAVRQLCRQAELPAAGFERFFGKQDPFAALVGRRPPDRPAAVQDGDEGMGFRPAGDHGVALRIDADDVEGGHGNWAGSLEAAGVCGGACGGVAGAAALGAAVGWARRLLRLRFGETGARSGPPPRAGRPDWPKSGYTPRQGTRRRCHR